MRPTKFCLTLALVLLCSFTGVAQEVDLTKGDLSILKGETSVNFEFTYEKMAVGDFSKEADYIKKRVEEENKKDPPNGDNWKREWEEQKVNYFGDKFMLGFFKSYEMKVRQECKIHTHL